MRLIGLVVWLPLQDLLYNFFFLSLCLVSTNDTVTRRTEMTDETGPSTTTMKEQLDRVPLCWLVPGMLCARIQGEAAPHAFHAYSHLRKGTSQKISLITRLHPYLLMQFCRAFMYL
jgi:hypothetical protein